MSVTLSVGMRIRTRCGEARIINRIGGGSQGDVYTVMYNGERKALKWYHDNVFLNRDDFVRNLQSNIDRGAPTKEFLWPLDRTDVTVDGTFGYIMDLCPPGYYEAGDLFIHPELFPSFKRIIDACLNIAHAFGILHDAGYVYRDISGGNFFIDPQTGKVLICDNDNVAPSNKDTGIRGTPRFMAPEVVATNNNPTEISDRHSLAVILFYLLLMQHPLEGRRADMLDGSAQKRLYGTDSLFVFDPYDRSNALRDDPHNNALKLWPILPRHMRNLFLRAFSQKALHEGRDRPYEGEWIRELVRLRSEVVLCPSCGRSEMFLEDARPQRCDNPMCRAVVQTPLRADLSLCGYSLPVVDDMRVYTCQTRLVSNAPDAIVPLLWVLTPNSGRGSLGALNISGVPLHAQAGGSEYEVPPNMAVAVRAGTTISVGEETITIRENSRQGA